MNVDTEELMHRRRGSKKGLARARCVRGCRAKTGKGRWSRKHKRTLGSCRRACGVKKS